MTLQLAAVLFFLAVSLLFYVLFAGADFGAGILELTFSPRQRKERREVISHAMAPIWEANHVWLILAVVILFVAFPGAYRLVCIHLHLPLLAILVGIVLRGCAFTFRHYDTLTSDYTELYSWLFAFSSLWTSLFLGMTAGAVMLGRIRTDALDYSSAYLLPWANSFSFSVGLFAVSLFGFLAAVYLVGESKTETQRTAFRKRAIAFSVAMVALGAAVFASAEANGLSLASAFLAQPLSWGSLLLATALLVPFWRALFHQSSSTWARGLGAVLVSLVLLGAFAVHYPVLIRSAPEALTFTQAVAPEPVLRSLLIALCVGSLLIFPALAYLFKVFKWETLDR